MTRRFLDRDALEVAPELLNKLLVRGPLVGRIVEVEAYHGGLDPASHAFRGPGTRNATMFGPPGHLYVYFTYGMHFCANVVCGPGGEASAVLLRALAPLAGVELMRAARPAARRDAELCAGPARLCQAFGIDRSLDGADLVGKETEIALLDDGTPPPAAPANGPRVGLSSRAAEAVYWQWRFAVPGNPAVSRPAPPGWRTSHLVV